MSLTTLRRLALIVAGIAIMALALGFPHLNQKVYAQTGSVPPVTGPASATVNMPPIAIATPLILTVAEGGSGTVNVSGTDIDGDLLDYIQTTAPVNGTLSGAPALDETSPVTATITYTHDGSETAGDSFAFKFFDGTVESNVVTVTVIITPVNDTPTANATSASVAEGGAVTITLTGSDPEAAPLTFNVPATTSHGALSDLTQISPTSASVLYTHNGSENFADSFTFTVNDGGKTSTPATVAITISKVNDNAPSATNGNANVNEGATKALTLAGTDLDGDVLFITIAGAPANGTLDTPVRVNATSFTVNYTHNGSETTSDSLTFTVSDTVNAPATGTFNLAIKPVNDNPPTATNGSASVNEGATKTLTLTGADPDNDELTITIASNPTRGTVGTPVRVDDTTFTVSYTHNGSETTSDSFTFAVDDGVHTPVVGTFSLTIVPVNDPPVAKDDTYAVDEDAGVTSFNVLGNDTDVEGDPITLGSVTQPANGTTSLNGSKNRVFYTPNPNYCNTPPGTSLETFTYTLTPGSSTATVSVTVNCLDDSPEAGDINVQADANQASVIDIAPHVTDPDDNLDWSTLTVRSQPSDGTATVDTDARTITYEPTPDFTGTDSLVYEICDADDNCDTGTITVSLLAIDLRLSKQDNGVTVEPGDLITYTLTFTNTGDDTVSGLVISDTVPVNTVFVAAASSGTWSCADQSGAGTTCERTAGSLAAGAAQSVIFAVQVVDPLTVGATTITNVATIRDDGTSGVELTPSDNRAEVTTAIKANIDPNAEKRYGILVDADNSGMPSPGDTIRYTITMTMTGNAPALGVTLTDNPDPATALVIGSVTTSTGSIISGNQPDDVAVRVNLDDLAIGATATVTYDVVIANPLPVGITELVNQALIDGANFPASASDDPGTPQPDDPTIILLVTKPKLVVLKEDWLAIDADATESVGLEGGNSPEDNVSPGDTLGYTLTIASTGNQAVSGVVLEDVVDPNTDLVVGSVTTSRGAITSGNDEGETIVGVTIGDMAGSNDTVIVTFRARIKNPIAGGVDEIVNQAVLSSNELPDVLSDDPVLSGSSDPTRTNLNAAAKVYVTLEDYFFVDSDANSMVTEGDILLYRVSIVNNGNRAATGLVLENQFPAEIALLPGTVGTGMGTIAGGNGQGDSTVRVELGTLVGGASTTVSYQVRIGNVDGLTSIANQVRITYQDLDDVRAALSDDPATTVGDDATKTPIGASNTPRNRLYLPSVMQR